MFDRQTPSADEDAAQADDRARLARRSLIRVARTLGCSVRDLHDESAGHPLGDALEILQLWGEIACEQGRRHVLDCAREVVAAQGGGTRGDG